MTDLKARAREIAKNMTDNLWDGDCPSDTQIESALLQFAREVLQAEPSEAMRKEGYLMFNWNAIDGGCVDIYAAMSAERAKELG